MGQTTACCKENCSGEPPDNIFVDEDGNPQSIGQSPFGGSAHPTSFTIELHNAKLLRSFATLGSMDPYAVVRADDAEEIARTEACKGGHKSPAWRAQVWKTTTVPKSIEIEVWDKNNYHKDVFCGSVVLPITPGMTRSDYQEFTLEKKDKPTGTIMVSMKIGYGQAGAGGMASDSDESSEEWDGLDSDDEETKVKRQERNAQRALRRARSNDREIDEKSAFTFDVHCAELLRSFASVGDMDPFAIVFAKIDNGDPIEIMRTEPAVGGHLNPQWDMTKTLDDCPEYIEIEVYDKNRFHKDVFCGIATVACSPDMGHLRRKAYDLEKHSKSTGTVTISIQVGDAAPPPWRCECLG